MNRKIINKALIYILIFPFVEYIWSLISILYLETGKYEWELDRYTYYIGATPAYIIFILAYLFGIWYIFWNRLKSYRDSPNELPVIKSWPLVLFLIFIIYLAVQIPYEYTYIDKHYMDKNPIFIFQLYYWFLPYIFFYLGHLFTFFFRFQYTLKMLLLLNFLGNISIIIALGNKFSLLVTLFNFFMIGYSTCIFSRIRSVNPYAIVKYFSLILLIALSIYSAYRFENDPNWLMNLFDRVFLLQGGMWWAAYYDWYIDDKLSLSDLITYWHLYPEEKNITIGYLMQQSIGLQKTRYIIEELAYYFSGGFPAFFLLLSSNLFICIFYLFIYGCLIGLLYAEIITSLLKGHLIAAFIILSIFLNIYQPSGNGDITFLLNRMFYLKLIIFLFYRFLFSSKNPIFKFYK